MLQMQQFCAEKAELLLFAYFKGVIYMEIKPIKDKIVVEVLDNETVTSSGIVIPDTAAEKPNQGKVVSVGPGKITEKGVLIPMSVETGNTVLFSKHAGQELKADGKEYLVIDEDDVMAILD